MGFFGKKEKIIVPEVREESREQFTSGNAELLSAYFGGRTNITADIAMQIPAVARCVNMIAGAVAMLPIKMYRREKNGVTEITDDKRLVILNGDTGDTLTADAMRYAWVRDYLLTGSAYAYIKRKYGIPVALHYVADRNVGVMKDYTDVIEKHYTYNVRGRTIHPYEMLKILRNTDGFGKGKGIVQENPLIVDMAYNYLKFQRVQLLKGGNKKGFLKTEKTVTKGTLDSIKAAWSNLYSNSDTTERVMVLNDGIDFKEISNTAVEMQLSEMASATNADIFKIFGTVDGMLSDETIKNAVMPILDVMESAFDTDLLTEKEKGLYYFAFDTRELTRGDINQRYSAYATALSQSFMQLDEVRALEDLPPLGVNFVKLGLNDVLLDPKTNRIYTPNTNAYADMGVPTPTEENNSDNSLDNKEGDSVENGNDNSREDM